MEKKLEKYFANSKKSRTFALAKQKQQTTMKRFRLTYNGITSEFNGTPCGNGGTMCGNKYITRFTHYAVRQSKTNLMKVTKLIECYDEDGNVNWHFYCKERVPRGLKLEVTIINA